MTRDELYNEIAKHTEDQYKSDMIITAVDAYTSAILQQCNVSLSLPLLNKVHEYLILLRQAKYGTPEARRLADEKLRHYATPIVEFEKLIGGNAS